MGGRRGFASRRSILGTPGSSRSRFARVTAWVALAELALASVVFEMPLLANSP